MSRPSELEALLEAVPEVMLDAAESTLEASDNGGGDEMEEACFGVWSGFRGVEVLEETDVDGVDCKLLG